MNKFQAEQFTWNSNFRLKHIGLNTFIICAKILIQYFDTRTGYYLTLKKLEDADLASITLERKTSANSIFHFRHVESLEDEEHHHEKEGLLTSDDFLRLQHVATGLWISVDDLTASMNEIDNNRNI